MMTGNINFTQEKLKELAHLPIDGKFQMINLLKFKAIVEGEIISGSDQYKKYMSLAIPFFIKSKARIVYQGHPKLVLIGPENEWDKMLIIEYSSKDDFIKMITSPGYPADLRSSALEDSRLILCK